MKIIDWINLKENLKNFDIIINATSLGLKGGQDFDFNFDSVKSNLIYIDTIYNPLETKTLKNLKERDIKVFNGLEMFIYQGQKAFYLWNKINPEIDQKLIETLLSKPQMKKIGITGSLASGKSTAGKILSSKNGPLFSADEEVQKLYRKKIQEIIGQKT